MRVYACVHVYVYIWAPLLNPTSQIINTMWAGGSQTEGSDAFAAPNARSEEGANACASGSSDTSSAASASDIGRRYEDIPRFLRSARTNHGRCTFIQEEKNIRYIWGATGIITKLSKAEN